jgi:hypothetical protein
MAHWQQGDKELARTLYDKTVEWSAKNSPDDDELRRFLAEAAMLLGIEDER